MKEPINVVIELAQKVAQVKAGGRAIEHGEWEHWLPLWAQEQLGVGPGTEPDLEEMERVLIGCGC